MAGRFFVDTGAGKTPKRVLPSVTKARFLQTEILCVEYDSLGPEQEEDLFSRVQLGVPLTPAEKLKASTGEWQTYTAEIESTYANLMNCRRLPKSVENISTNIMKPSYRQQACSEFPTHTSNIQADDLL